MSAGLYPSGFPFPTSYATHRVDYSAACPTCGGEATFQSVGVNGRHGGAGHESTRLTEVLVHCPACDKGDATA